MGLFSRKSESISVEEFREMANFSDKQLKKLIADGKVPQRTPAQLRKAAKEVIRKTEGERGLGAAVAGLKGGGTGNRNHQNIPLKDRVHPAEYRRILEREAKRQGLI